MSNQMKQREKKLLKQETRTSSLIFIMSYNDVDSDFFFK